MWWRVEIVNILSIEFSSYSHYFLSSSPNILPAPCFHTPTIHILPMWWEMKFDTSMKLKWNSNLACLNPYVFEWMKRQNNLNEVIVSISKIENCSEFLDCGFHCNRMSTAFQISIIQCMKECSLPTSKQNSWNNTMHFMIPCQECCVTVWCCVHYVSFEFFSMVIEDSGFLVCVTTLMGKWFLTFWWMFGLLGLKLHGPWSFGDEGDLSF